MMFDLVRRIIKDPVTQTLVLGAVLVVLGGMFRPPEMNFQAGVDPSYLFLDKAHNARGYDVVIAGDSRTYCALSPAVVNKTLGTNHHIINFAFEGLGYTKEYLDRLPQVIDTNHPRPVIILGLTPMSLTRGTTVMNGYQSAIQKTGWPLMRDMYMPAFLRFFKPYDWRFAIRWLKREDPFRLIWHFHADGFVGIEKKPLRRDLVVESFGHRFDGNPVQQYLVDQLLEYVQRWSDQGIRVYGFRPPTCEEMMTKELEVAGFDSLNVPVRFNEAGGVWIDISQTAYYSYDGSHLSRAGALEFSQDFASRLEELGW